MKKFLTAIAVGVLASLTLATAPAQAATVEINATTGTGITVSPQNCIDVYPANSTLSAGTVCFQPEGDILNVVDRDSDGHSVALRWYNYYQGSLYREGACVESRAAGSSGTCNKNFHEGSRILIRACLWESGPNTPVRCGDAKNLTA